MEYRLTRTQTYLGCCFSHIKDRDFSCEGKAVVIHVMLEGNSPVTFPTRRKKKKRHIKFHLPKLIDVISLTNYNGKAPFHWEKPNNDFPLLDVISSQYHKIFN